VAFQLTDRSLDLDDPRHRSTLDATYEAFPEIRNRVVP
jgi:hypothetical protein